MSGSLVDQRLMKGVEAYVIPLKPAVRTGGRQGVQVVVHNNGSSKSLMIEVLVEKPSGSTNTLCSASRSLAEGEVAVFDCPVDAVDEAGVHRVKALIDGAVIDEAEYLVISSDLKKAPYFTIVWHNHQAPNYMPNWKIHSPWAYVYVWGGYLAPYGYGPYHYHAKLLNLKKSFKSTYNLSPSLLAQWLMAVEKGVEFLNGEQYDPESFNVRMVSETIALYREALERGQIDVLTSVYAHTIAGYLLDWLEASDIVSEELSYGKSVTVKAFGSSYVPLGAWTPEMCFSMGLVPIYASNGIEYTVLDEEYHFKASIGDKGTYMEPYIALNTVTGDHLIVFFRDTELSNMFSFKNDFLTELHAWRNAYQFSYIIARRALNHLAKVLVLALDGENWMVFSKNPPLTAYFLDKLSDYLLTLNSEGALKLSNLKEMFEEVPCRRVLKYIPTNSWLGSSRKWRGEKEGHENYWLRVAKVYRALKVYEEAIGLRSDESSKVRWALWHALDSDYWWAEFWSPLIIDLWLKEAESIVTSLLQKISIDSVKVEAPLIEGVLSEVEVVIENKLSNVVKLKPSLHGLGAEVISQVNCIRVEPHSSSSIRYSVKPLTWGKVVFIAVVQLDDFIVDLRVAEAYVNPRIA